MRRTMQRRRLLLALAGSAEVQRVDHGWVAMDPADVGKVMRLETAEWLKITKHPVVVPVNKALSGGREGNWRAFIVAH